MRQELKNQEKGRPNKAMERDGCFAAAAHGWR